MRINESLTKLELQAVYFWSCAHGKPTDSVLVGRDDRYNLQLAFRTLDLGQDRVHHERTWTNDQLRRYVLGCLKRNSLKKGVRL